MADRKVTKTVDVDAGSITFVFATGETETVDVTTLPAETQKQLMLHGASQKLGDSYSGEDADKCHTIMMGVVKNLTEGTWSARSGGGGGSPRISQLAEALSRAAGEPLDACVEKLSAMDDDVKKQVRAHPAVQAALAEIKLEKAQADAARLKEELGDAPKFTL